MTIASRLRATKATWSLSRNAFTWSRIPEAIKQYEFRSDGSVKPVKKEGETTVDETGAKVRHERVPWPLEGLTKEEKDLRLSKLGTCFFFVCASSPRLIVGATQDWHPARLRQSPLPSAETRSSRRLSHSEETSQSCKYLTSSSAGVATAQPSELPVGTSGTEIRSQARLWLHEDPSSADDSRASTGTSPQRPIPTDYPGLHQQRRRLLLTSQRLGHRKSLLRPSSSLNNQLLKRLSWCNHILEFNADAISPCFFFPLAFCCLFFEYVFARQRD